jgi:nucleoside-diphosphate-sugar epimerase
MAEKILITGGAGYLGSTLTPVLLAAGYDVTVLDSFMFQQNSLADCCHYDSFHVMRGDCRDEKLLTKLVSQADIIIPLAALVGAPLCARDAIGAQTINAGAVQTLCRIASKDLVEGTAGQQRWAVPTAIHRPADEVAKLRPVSTCVIDHHAVVTSKC